MSQDTQHLAYLAVAKGDLASLRTIAESCENRDVARMIYSEIRNIGHKLAVMHDFKPTERPRKEIRE